MKCSRCGHKTRTLAAMAAHVRKKHPGAMKRKVRSTFERGYKMARGHYPEHYGPEAHGKDKRFCPHCGGFLGD